MIKITEIKDLWSELLGNFIKGIENSIELLEKKDVENIPGAIKALLDRLNNMKTVFSHNNGEFFIKTIDERIQKAFFPNSKDFTEAFNLILKSRTHEQDFIINELLNGFITSKARMFAGGTQGTIIDKLVEAFKNSGDFHIVDHQFYAMFGNPTKPRKFVREGLQQLVYLFGLISKQVIIEKDIRRHEKKIYNFYTFPEDYIKVLKDKYLFIDDSVKSINSQDIIDNAISLAYNNNHQKFDPIHIFISLIENDVGIIRAIFEKLDVNINQLSEELKRDLKKLPIYTNLDENSMEPSLYSEILIHSAWEEADKLKDEFPSSEHLLIALAINREKTKIRDVKLEDYQLAYLTQKLERYGANKDRIIRSLMNIRGKRITVTEEFDSNIFICMFLANLAINRDDLEKIGGVFTVNGISAILALILFLGTMPKLTIGRSNPILDNKSFNSDNMSVIPKSWMIKQVLEYLFEPLIKIVAYRLGGGLWLSKIKKSKINKKIHNQIRFLLKDVNKWVLGNLCRVEIPIFVEISNIFVNLMLGMS